MHTGDMLDTMDIAMHVRGESLVRRWCVGGTSVGLYTPHDTRPRDIALYFRGESVVRRWACIPWQ